LNFRAFKEEKEDFCSVMAFPTPAAVLLDENMHIHRGEITFSQY
jgi:hypothetical protein